MSQKTTIICDGCDKDLTYTENCEEYYLVVGSASKLAVTAPPRKPSFLYHGHMSIQPPVPRTLHFCDLDCFDRWRKQ